MSFDITFHPISKEELQGFFLAVLAQPNRAGEKAANITTDPEKESRLLGIYEECGDVFADVKKGSEPFSTLVLGAAAIAGFLHPYWYARGSAISFLIDEDERFEPLTRSLFEMFPRAFAGLKDDSEGMILDNYSGGGYVPNGNLPALKSMLLDDEYEDAVATVFAEESFEALLEAIEYALDHGTGLLEVADLVVPSEGEVFTDPDNLRAHYLENVDDHDNARDI